MTNKYPVEIRILVVEDSPVQAAAIKHLLEEQDYSVTLACNGKEALDKVLAENFTLIISDILMPEMDGYDFCSVVKADPGLKHIPVILLTELSDPDDIIKGLQAGADNFITKPYSEKYLLSRIQHLLDNLEFRKDDKNIILNIVYRSKKYTIYSEKQQIFDLLISIFETAMEKNKELFSANESLQEMNELLAKKNEELVIAHEEMIELKGILEERVRERTKERDKQIDKHLETIDKLRQSEERFRSIVETINDFIWEVDSKGVYNYVSPTVAQVLGYEPSEILGKTPFDLMAPGEAHSISNKFKKIIADFSPLTGLENINVKKNGEIVVLETSGVPIFDFSGKFKGYRGIDRDITLRKQNEELIQKSAHKEKIRNMISGLFLTIPDDSVYKKVLDIVLDETGSKDGFFGQLNEKNLLIILTFSGKLMEECNVKNKTNIFPVEKWCKSTWGRTIKENRSFFSNKPLKGFPGGKHVKILNNISVPLDYKGEVIGILSVANGKKDYTEEDVRIVEDIVNYLSPLMYSRMELNKKELERKKYEDELKIHQLHLEELVSERTDELKKERDMIEAIITSVADGVIVTDLNQKVILMNHAAEEQLDTSFEKVRGESVTIVIKEYTLREKLKYIMETIKTEYEFDFTMHRDHNGADRIMHGKTSIIVDMQKNCLGTVTIISDVTLEREIDRMKTEFISTAAHELRTPLTSIQGFSEILLTRNNLDESKKKKYLTYINSQAVKLAHIVRDLLDIARIESGKGFLINREDCQVKPILTTVIPYFESISNLHSFKLYLPEPHSSFFADKNLVEQVLKNLLANSIKYSPKGGVITINCKTNGNFFQISIEDQGIGMTPEQVKRVFDKFYRVDASDSAPEGTGLGMTIVKYIVEAHEGKIWIESELGKGTKVYFTIPLKEF